MLRGYITEHIRKKCEEHGYTCPFWVDKDIEKALYKADEIDNGNRLKKYYSMCHEVYFIYDSDIKMAQVLCRNYDVSSGINVQCTYCNPFVADQIVWELNEK